MITILKTKLSDDNQIRSEQSSIFAIEILWSLIVVEVFVSVFGFEFLKSRYLSLQFQNLSFCSSLNQI